MRKVFSRIIVTALVMVLAVPTVFLSARTGSVYVDGTYFIHIRQAAYDAGASVEWDGANQVVIITTADGWTFTVYAAESGGFNDNGRIYIPVELAERLFHERQIPTVIPETEPEAETETETETEPDYLIITEPTSHLHETIETANMLATLFLDDFDLSGLVVTIVDAQNDFTWVQGFGYADTSLNIPVEPDTVFLIASVSKAITALAVMQLVEEGIIDPDTPIIEYLPDFSMLPSETGGDYRNITTRMLLTHTAGVITQNDFLTATLHLNEITDGEHDPYYITLDGHNPHFMNNFFEIMALHYMDAPENTSFSYSNNGFVLLGVLLAAKTGNDDFFNGFEQYMQTNIFLPAGMTRSSFVLDSRLKPFLAQPYENSSTPGEYFFPNGLPTASMVSTGNDMAQLMYLLLNGSSEIVSPSTLRYMQTPHELSIISSPGAEIGYGFGFLTFEFEEGQILFGHNGAWSGGYQSMMLMNQDTGLGVFVAINTFTEEIFETADLLALMILLTALEEVSGN